MTGLPITTPRRVQRFCLLLLAVGAGLGSDAFAGVVPANEKDLVFFQTNSALLEQSLKREPWRALEAREDTVAHFFNQIDVPAQPGMAERYHTNLGNFKLLHANQDQLLGRILSGSVTNILDLQPGLPALSSARTNYHDSCWLELYQWLSSESLYWESVAPADVWHVTALMTSIAEQLTNSVAGSPHISEDITNGLFNLLFEPGTNWGSLGDVFTNWNYLVTQLTTSPPSTNWNSAPRSLRVPNAALTVSNLDKVFNIISNQLPGALMALGVPLGVPQPSPLPGLPAVGLTDFTNGMRELTPALAYCRAIVTRKTVAGSVATLLETSIRGQAALFQKQYGWFAQSNILNASRPQDSALWTSQADANAGTAQVVQDRLNAVHRARARDARTAAAAAPLDALWRQIRTNYVAAVAHKLLQERGERELNRMLGEVLANLGSNLPQLESLVRALQASRIESVVRAWDVAAKYADVNMRGPADGDANCVVSYGFDAHRVANQETWDTALTDLRRYLSSVTNSLQVKKSTILESLMPGRNREGTIVATFFKDYSLQEIQQKASEAGPLGNNATVVLFAFNIRLRGDWSILNNHNLNRLIVIANNVSVSDDTVMKIGDNCSIAIICHHFSDSGSATRAPKPAQAALLGTNSQLYVYSSRTSQAPEHFILAGPGKCRYVGGSVSISNPWSDVSGESPVATALFWDYWYEVATRIQEILEMNDSVVPKPKKALAWTLFNGLPLVSPPSESRSKYDEISRHIDSLVKQELPSRIESISDDDSNLKFSIYLTRENGAEVGYLLPDRIAVVDSGKGKLGYMHETGRSERTYQLSFQVTNTPFSTEYGLPLAQRRFSNTRIQRLPPERFRLKITDPAWYEVTSTGKQANNSINSVTQPRRRQVNPLLSGRVDVSTVVLGTEDGLRDFQTALLNPAIKPQVLSFEIVDESAAPEDSTGVSYDIPVNASLRSSTSLIASCAGGILRMTNASDSRVIEARSLLFKDRRRAWQVMPVNATLRPHESKVLALNNGSPPLQFFLDLSERYDFTANWSDLFELAEQPAITNYSIDFRGFIGAEFPCGDKVSPEHSRMTIKRNDGITARLVADGISLANINANPDKEKGGVYEVTGAASADLLTIECRRDRNSQPVTLEFQLYSNQWPGDREQINQTIQREVEKSPSLHALYGVKRE